MTSNQPPATEPAGISTSTNSGSVSGWLTSPFVAAAATLKSLTATNLRDVPTAQIQRAAAHHQQQQGLPPPRTHFHRAQAKKPGTVRSVGPGGAVPFDADAYVYSSRDVSRRNSFGNAADAGLQFSATPMSAVESSTPIAATPAASSATPIEVPNGFVFHTQTQTDQGAYRDALAAATMLHPSPRAHPPPAPQFMPASKEHHYHLQLEESHPDDLGDEESSFAMMNGRVDHSLAHARSARPSRSGSVDHLEEDFNSHHLVGQKVHAMTAQSPTSADALPTGSPHAPVLASLSAPQPAAPSMPFASLAPAAASLPPADQLQSSYPSVNGDPTTTAAANARAVSAPASSLTAQPAPPAASGSKLASIPDLSSFSSASYEDQADTDPEEGDDAATELAETLAGATIPFFKGRAPTAPAATATEKVVDHISSAEKTNGIVDDPNPPLAPRNVKLLNFQRLLTSDEQADLSVLRKMSWNGIPQAYRALAWKLLLGYLPTRRSRREATLLKRRGEYESYLRDFYYLGSDPKLYDDAKAAQQRSENEWEILKQIRQDVPRTSPAIRYFKDPPVQKSLERILYIFAIRHPASGYVQGINDLATPFYCEFVRELYGVDILSLDVSPLQEEDYLSIEADVFWCLSYLIDGIQDHYTFAQPGIQRMVYKLKELILRIDGDGTTTTHVGAQGLKQSSDPAAPSIGLHAHFERENVQFLHFGFRWMSVLLMRELKLPLILRLWDSYLSEEPSFSTGFKVLHVYVCAAFLMKWKEELKKMDFQALIQFLQRLPTDDWTEQTIETLLAQAHVYKTLFHESAHMA